MTQLRSGSAQSESGSLPIPLRAGIESLSGMDMGHVVVHRNSDKPAQLNALAFAQGSEIHLGPGQDKHLPHEAWHVVQQAQGRVAPTLHAGDGTPVNDDHALEREADLMGAKAVQQKQSADQALAAMSSRASSAAQAASPGSIQKMVENHRQSAEVTQLWHGYKATYESDFSYVKAIFRQRMADKTATTGIHNYAYDLDTGLIEKSGTSGHAEILLLSKSRASHGGSVTLISEYKPCKPCQKQIEEIEEARGLEVRVIWLLDYEEKGDGDKDATREFYRGKGWLAGGGDYVYSVSLGDK